MSESNARCPRRSNRVRKRLRQKPPAARWGDVVPAFAGHNCRDPEKNGHRLSAWLIGQRSSSQAPILTSWPAGASMAILPTSRRPTGKSCIAPLDQRRHHPCASARRRPFDRDTPGSAASRGECRRTRKEPLNLRPSPNSALQRAGTHKLLGRGRTGVIYLRALARPRADALACRR